MLSLPVRGRLDASALTYRPGVLGVARVGFRDARAGIQADKDLLAYTPLTEAVLPADWEAARLTDLTLDDMEPSCRDGIPMAALPPAATQAKSYTGWSREFADWLFRTQSIELFHAPSLKETSMPGESERDFRIRIQLKSREMRDRATEELRKKYAAKVAALEERIRKSEQAVEREQDQAKQQRMQTAISFGTTLLSAFMGKKKINASSVGRATTAIRGASRTLKESGDVARSKETVDALGKQQEDLEAAFRAETDALTAQMDPQNLALETVVLRPMKSNIQVRLVSLAWLPYRTDTNGVESPAWE